MTMKSWRQNTNLLKVGGNCPPPHFDRVGLGRPFNPAGNELP